LNNSGNWWKNFMGWPRCLAGACISQRLPFH